MQARTLQPCPTSMYMPCPAPQVAFDTAAEIRDFLLSAVHAHEGWQCAQVSVSIPGGAVHTFPFWHRDLAAYVRQQYGNVQRGQGFVTHSQNGDLSQPWAGWVWREEEAAARQRLGAQAVLAALQLYSDATQVNFKNLSVHPVYCALLNR